MRPLHQRPLNGFRRRNRAHQSKEHPRISHRPYSYIGCPTTTIDSTRLQSHVEPQIFRRTEYRVLPDLLDRHQNDGPGLGPVNDPPGNYHPLTFPAAVSVDGDPQPTTRPRPVDPLMMHQKGRQTPTGHPPVSSDVGRTTADHAAGPSSTIDTTIN